MKKWKPIPRFNNRYELSTTGKVYDSRRGSCLKPNKLNQFKLYSSVKDKPLWFTKEQLLMKTFGNEEATNGS